VRVGEFLERPAERLKLPPSAQAGHEVDAGTQPEQPLHELLLASVPTPVLRSFRERLLGPLWEYDDRHNAELISTLRSFLACDGSWSACASRMYLHVNTVRYRIGRIEALTGRDMSALADRVDFFLALRGA
jgi:DNA-binding PucR family transcriptional regulator